MDFVISNALQKSSSSIKAALLLVSANLILWEVLLTRIYSTILFYHFAFMAVSVSMFGLTLGAVLVFILPAIEEKLELRMTWLALATAAASVTAICAQLFMPLIPVDGEVPVTYMVATYLLSALPFVPGGAFICLALTRYSDVGPLYAADLAGAAAGCVAMPLMIVHFQGPGTVLAAAGFSCVAAMLMARNFSKRMAMGALAIGVLIIGVAEQNISSQWLRVRYMHGGAVPLMPYERWNAFSRIVVRPMPENTAFGWGIDDSFTSELTPVKQRWLTIDSGAGTPITYFDGNLAQLGHLKVDVTGAAHRIRTDGDVCVIGPGGGRDMLAALAYKQHSVVGVEVNPEIVFAVNTIFGSYTGHLDLRKDVAFAVDDGRSWLERTDKRFDIIQASLVDTIAATAAGAYAFTENGLYTVEAWDMFMRRLKPRGVLSFSRFYYGATTWPVEVYRLVALTTAALRKRGISDPSRHIILIRNKLDQSQKDKIGTLLVSPDPFDEKDVENAKQACRELRAELALAPGVSTDKNFEFLFKAGNSELIAKYPLDVTPTYDDRPYFFFHSRLADVLSGKETQIFGGSAFNMPAVRMLVTLTLTVLILGAGLVLFPVIWLRMKGQSDATKGSAAIPVYFAAIGIGFMLVEIGLIQRLSLFLGHPIYGFTVVLFGLLLSGGIGSLISDRLLKWIPPQRHNRILVFAGVVIFAAEILSREFLQRAIGEATSVRIMLTLLIICPTAALMGFGFPMGMGLAREQNDSRTAWFWAINGAMSVIGSVLAMLCSIELGIRMTILCGMLIYFIAAVIHGMTMKAKPAIDASAPAS